MAMLMFIYRYTSMQSVNYSSGVKLMLNELPIEIGHILDGRANKPDSAFSK